MKKHIRNSRWAFRWYPSHHDSTRASVAVRLWAFGTHCSVSWRTLTEIPAGLIGYRGKYIGVSINGGTPKCRVYKGKSDLWMITSTPIYGNPFLCLNIPNGDTTGLVLQGGSICSMGNFSWTHLLNNRFMGWNRASFHGSNGDFSGFIQTLESDFRTNGGVSRKKMDRLTMINTYTHTVNFSTANIDKNGDAIIFDRQSLEFQQHKWWMSCWVYTLIVEYGWIWGILKKTMNHHQAPPFLFKTSAYSTVIVRGSPLVFFLVGVSGVESTWSSWELLTKVTSLTDLTWTSL